MSTIKFRKTSDGSYPYTFQDIQNSMPNTSIPAGMDLTVFGFEPVLPVETPAYNSKIQQLVEISPVKTNDKWFQNWMLIDIPFTLEDLNKEKQQLKDQLASLRYQKETGGFDFNGFEIKTDVESQAKVNSAFVALQAGFITDVDWKAKNGWVKLHLPEITVLATAIANHVRNCFTKEKQVTEMIDAIQSLDELELFNLNTEWNKG